MFLKALSLIVYYYRAVIIFLVQFSYNTNTIFSKHHALYDNNFINATIETICNNYNYS